MTSIDTKKLEREQILSYGREAMKVESDAVVLASKKLGNSFVDAVEIIYGVKGKAVVTGLGKSGHVARKIAATLASTGTPAFFLHPSEGLHGDLGMLHSDDVVIALAFGGETYEVIEASKFARRIGVPVICITGKTESQLSQISDVVLDGSVHKEVCPLNLAPTASTAVALAIGDALAMALMQLRGFKEVDFASLHPGGTLGRRLSLVSDHMQLIDSGLSSVALDAGFHDILKAVTSRNFGIAPVISEDGALKGAISDGDIRRALLKYRADALNKKAEELMSPEPVTVLGSLLALDAFKVMENKQITSLFVLHDDQPSKLVGIVRMHDLLAAKIV